MFTAVIYVFFKVIILGHRHDDVKPRKEVPKNRTNGSRKDIVFRANEYGIIIEESSTSLISKE